MAKKKRNLNNNKMKKRRTTSRLKTVGPDEMWSLRNELYAEITKACAEQMLLQLADLSDERVKGLRAYNFY